MNAFERWRHDAPTSQQNRSRERLEAIYDTIRRRIALSEYEPGQRLSEEKLAAEFGVSRTPLRKALSQLENEGLIHSKRSVGTIVTDYDLETLTQVYRMRAEVAELWGKVDPVEDTSEIEEICRELLVSFEDLQKTQDRDAYAEMNLKYFHAGNMLTRNRPLRRFAEQLFYQSARIWHKSMESLDMASEVDRFRQDVAAFLACLESGDVEAAAHIRRAHISTSCVMLKRMAREEVME